MKQMHCIPTRVYNGELLPKGDFWKPDRESDDVMGIFFGGPYFGVDTWCSMYSDNRSKMKSKTTRYQTEAEACDQIAKRIQWLRNKQAQAQQV